MSNVTNINIELFFALDDNFILELARTCPKLVHLHLGVNYSSRRRSDATLNSYAHIVKHCARINHIGLVVDASLVEPRVRVHPVLGIRSLPSPVEFEFAVGDSFIEDPSAVAAFLSSLLDPHIQPDSPYKPRITPARNCTEEIRGKWNTVSTLFPIFLAVRAQEATKALFVSETSVNENSGANHAVCR
jgi:hypothetical protein